MRRNNVKKGQVWRKKQTVHDKPFFVHVIGKGKSDGIKAVCSDGNTHNFVDVRLFLKRYELVDSA